MSYLSKRFNMDSLKRINIQKVGVYYRTYIDNIKEEYRDEYSDFDSDSVQVNEHDLDKHLIDMSEAEYYDTDMFEIKSFVNELLKNYKHYLVVALHSRWNGASGYIVADNKIDCFYRDYDCSQYVLGGSKGGKYLYIKEYHHDVPMGHNTLIMGLTDRDYVKVDNMTIEDIIKFAENKIDLGVV